MPHGAHVFVTNPIVMQCLILKDCKVDLTDFHLPFDRADDLTSISHKSKIPGFDFLKR